MISHGKIIVATDFSEQSDEALRRGIKMAHAFDTDIYLLHVMEPFMLYDSDSMLSMPVEDLSEVRRKGAHDRLEAQAAKVRNGVTIYPKIIENISSPAAGICQAAAEMQADMIVLGRHGDEGFLEHLLIGSTAEQVVRLAPCTVVVSRQHGVEGEASKA